MSDDPDTTSLLFTATSFRALEAAHIDMKAFEWPPDLDLPNVGDLIEISTDEPVTLVVVKRKLVFSQGTSPQRVITFDLYPDGPLATDLELTKEFESRKTFTFPVPPATSH